MSEHASWGFEQGAELAPGRTVLKGLGGGNRYEVFLVWDETLFSLAVAKALRPDQVEDEKALRDLAGEADVLAALAHPVLIRSFDAVLDGPHPHVLIEHLEGPSLRRLIRRGGALPLEQALPMGLHVAGVLEYMARTGFAHLDVKPDNIVMGVPPRLIDLSIARPLERAARNRGPLGTDAYMAPEQTGAAEAAGTIGPAADAWGWGATMFHALAGARPFPRDSEAADEDERRFPQLAHDPQALPDHVPAEVADAVLATLRTDPADRPSCAEVIEALQPVVAELPSRLSLSRRGARGI